MRKIAFAAIAVTLLAAVTILATSSGQSASASGGDACQSLQFGDGPITAMGCSADKQTFRDGNDKKECREFADKCSSSQTGFGVFDNTKP